MFEGAAVSGLSLGELDLKYSGKNTQLSGLTTFLP